MRAVAVAAVVLLLAGCSSPPAEAPVDPVVVEELPPPVRQLLVDDTFVYNHEPTGVQTVYDPVTSVAVNPCIFQGKPYFNDRVVPTDQGFQPRIIEAGDLQVTLDWTETDYPFQTLVVGYRAPGIDGWQTSERIPKGTPTDIRIQPADLFENLSWGLAICLNNDGSPSEPGWQPGPFLGSFHVKAEFIPDGAL